MVSNFVFMLTRIFSYKLGREKEIFFKENKCFFNVERKKKKLTAMVSLDACSLSLIANGGRRERGRLVVCSA
jgi:hypothetical protein